MANNIITIWEDTAHTKALYPRTLDTAISCADGSSLYTKLNSAGFKCIDVSKILAQNVTSYTATEDCIIEATNNFQGNFAGTIAVDDVVVIKSFTHYMSSAWWCTLTGSVIVKKGSTIKSNSSSITFNVYGLK